VDWLEPWLRNETTVLAAGGVAAAALALAVLFGLLSAWFNWRATRMTRIARLFRGRQRLAEEQLSSFAAEEKDLQRLIAEMERAEAKG
jgi:hypothetical protein